MKYVICGNYGVKNVGDEWIAEGLEMLIKEQHPQALITRMGAGQLMPFGIRSFIKSLVNWKLWKTPLALVRSCDVFVLGGGGLFTDEERPLTALFWALHGLCAQKLGKKVIVAGVSIGKLNWLSKLALGRLLPKVSSCYLRDDYSVKKTVQLGARNAQFCPDLAAYYLLSLKPEMEQVSKSQKYVLFVLREYKDFDKNKITIFAQLADRLYAENGLKSVFIGFDGVRINDTNLMNKIHDQSLIKSNIIVHRFTGNDEYIASLFKNAEVVLAMRFHALIGALVLSVPLISIEYMKKSEIFWDSWATERPATQKLSTISVKSLFELIRATNDGLYKNNMATLSNSYLSLLQAKKPLF